MLPALTPLQYLVLHLLFAGPQSGEQLRRASGDGTAADPPVVLPPDGPADRCRLCRAGAGQPVEDNGARIHFCRYQITDLGLYDWNAARKFYLNLAPPSCPPAAVPTEQGQLAAYDPQTRKAAIKRAADRYARRLSAVMLETTRPRSRMRPYFDASSTSRRRRRVTFGRRSP